MDINDENVRNQNEQENVQTDETMEEVINSESVNESDNVTDGLSNNNVQPTSTNLQSDDAAKEKSKKKIIIVSIIILFVLIFGVIKLVRGCIFHSWQPATCTSAETCKDCGSTRGEPLEHKFLDATCTDPQICSVCFKKQGEPLGHSAGEWTVVKASTCTEEGTKTAECTVCGEIVTESIDKLQHKPGEWKITKAATISTSGEKQQTCAVCGTVLDTDTYELSTAEKMNAYKAQCQSYTYNEIARNPDTYKGKYAVFTGEVIQSMEDGDTYVFRVNVTKGKYTWSDTLLVYYTKKDSNEARILEDDVITIYGMLSGTYTYETVMGSNMTLPLMYAEYISIN